MDTAAENEARLAIQGFRIPEGIEAKLWAAEPLLVNPVCFGIDEFGRIYVCETFRQSKGVEDNRGHMDWLEDDLSLQTVEERGEMFKKYLGEDIGRYAEQEDRIRLLTDRDDDGHADESVIFADGFNDILDGTGAGVLAINGDVYYTCIPDLYLLRDTNGDGRADEKESLQHGFGVRVAFRGHDMHGLTLGPDGRIYFSIGDRGYNVMTDEGNHYVRPDAGAVFRCERDGSHLEVFAYGLRNPQELAFDDYGNLFTGDNNSDGGDQARWVYVVQGGDSGWRMYYQYLSDRGPWNRERMWFPYHADEATTAVQPAFIVPPILNVSDGPSGLVYYPGVGLDERYEGHFFLADFRGSAGNSGVRSFAVKGNGASFELVDSHWFLQSILATDVDFGYDGKMYVSDWVDGWEGASKGRLYTFSDPAHKNDPAVLETRELMRAGFAELGTEKLLSLLSHADRRVRQRAQFQLADAGEAQALQDIASAGDTQPLLARIHAVWGLGQLLRRGAVQPDVLLPLLDEKQDAELRTQVITILGDDRAGSATEAFITRLEQGAAREQAAAAITLGKIKAASAVKPLLQLLSSNADTDPVVRHAAIMGLVGCSDAEAMAALSGETSRSIRLGAVVALRRWKSPELARFLKDPDPDVALEAARAIHDLPVEEALPALAAISWNATMPDAFVRRILNANFRLGGADQARAIARIAADQNVSDDLRGEAMMELLLWENPPRLDRETNEFRPLGDRDGSLVRPAVQESLSGMLLANDQLRRRAIRLAARYQIPEVTKVLSDTLGDDQASPETRSEALAAMASLEVSDLDAVLQKSLEDSAPAVRAQALAILSQRNPSAALPKIKQVLQSGTQAEQQSALEVLGKMQSDQASQILLNELDAYQAGNVPAGIQLDLLQAAELHESEAFRNKLKAIETARPADDPLARFREVLEGGNADRGREIFFGSAAASCRRCHKINGSGSDVGPDLSEVAKKNSRDYLLESIVLPNAKIAQGFETVVFAMEDGHVISGVVKAEDDETYTVMKPEGEKVVLNKSEIDATAKGKSGMPDDLTKQLSKSNIRDLVEYLSTLKEAAPQEGHVQ